MNATHSSNRAKPLTLVAPPVQLPGAPATVLQAAAAAMPAVAGGVTCVNAAGSFWRDYLADDRHLAQLGERGLDLDADARKKLSKALVRLCEATVAHIDGLIADLQVLDRALEQLSTAFAPAAVDRRGFFHPDLTDLERLRAFAHGSLSNPFSLFGRWWVHHRIDLEGTDGVVFLCLTPGQVAAAATLAAEILRDCPRMPVEICRPGQPPFLDMNALFPDKAGIRQIPSPLRQSLARVLPAIHDTGYGHAPGGPVQVMDTRDMEPAKDQPPHADTKLVVWHMGEAPPSQWIPVLFDWAKKGLWHHLLLETDPDQDPGWLHFVSDNPNIAHSWGWHRQAASAFGDRRIDFPRAAAPYGKTAPMPGQPVWQILQDPFWLLTGLSLLGRNPLTRQWASAGSQPSVQLGSSLQYHYLPPADVPEAIFEEIIRMVDAGGSVNTRWVRHNLSRAYLIAYAEENGVIAGNSSLKHPRQEYIGEVSRQSGIDLTRFLERGYTSVRPQYRGLGIGTRMLEGLTRRAGDYKIFSVIAEDNLATQKMAIRNRTRKVAQFYSQKAKKPIGIWIPEWMIDETIPGVNGDKP